MRLYRFCMTITKILTIGLFVFIGSFVEAKVFSNPYISFQIPDDWNCLSEKTEWVCRNKKQKHSKEAVIMLTSKQANLAKDNLATYTKHLQQPQLIYSRDKKVLTSKVIHVKPTRINGQQWIDGWHLNSEVPNYYTRYLATARNGLGILVTFSAHKSKYTQYNRTFFSAIHSLRITAGKNFFKSKNRLGGTLGGRFTSALLEGEEEEVFTNPKDDSLLLWVLLALVGVIVGFLFLSKRKKRQRGF